MINIIPIPALTDNYIWALSSKATSGIVVVDPGAAQQVLEFCQRQGAHLIGILVTHHHWDHTGGVVELLRHYPNIAVYASGREKLPGVTHTVKEGDSVAFAELNLTLKVFEIPGHTLDHVAYYNDDILFCGDTLFSCGCGRVFEGTMAQMVNSLAKLKKLNPNTAVYCGHEYTLANIRFAKQITPNLPALLSREQQAQQQRANGLPTLPTTLKEELSYNPFLRCEDPTVIQSVQKHGSLTHIDPVTIFTELRSWKNSFN